MSSSSNELKAPFEASEGNGDPRRWWILAVLAAVAFMAQLDLFIVNLALPAMGRSFSGSGLDGLSWVLNGYAIVLGSLLVPAGRFADHYGRRRFLLGGVAVFTAASVLCALAPSLPVLVVGRVLQAAGAAALVPTSLALLYPAFPARQHTTVVGVWAGVAAVAAAAGPPVGGLLVAVDWRWIFVINVPIGVAVLLAGRALLPEARAARDARLPSGTSVACVLAAVALVVLATIEAPDRGWGPESIGLCVAAAMFVVLAVLTTTRSARPVIEPDLFGSPQFARAALTLVLFFIAFSAWLLIGVMFLQNAWGYSALRAGAALVPGPAAAAVFALNSGRIADLVGRRVPAVAGPALVAAAGLFWLTFTPATPSYLTGFLPGQILGGIGSGLAQAPLFAAAGTLAAARVTTGSALLNMCRQLGSAFGVALLVAAMATQHPTELNTFHRGWGLVVVAALLATASQAIRRRTPSTTEEIDR